MTKKDFKIKMKEGGFDYAMRALYEEEEYLTDFGTLKNFAISNIENDDIFLAIHILNALYENEGDSDWYYYDYTAGTLCTPICLSTIEDVEQCGMFE